MYFLINFHTCIFIQMSELFITSSRESYVSVHIAIVVFCVGSIFSFCDQAAETGEAPVIAIAVAMPRANSFFFIRNLLSIPHTRVGMLYVNYIILF